MAENNIEENSNIDKISQEKSDESNIKKQEKPKTTRTTTRRSTTKKSSTTTSTATTKSTKKSTTSKTKASKATDSSTAKKSTKTSSNKIKKEDSDKELIANVDPQKKSTEATLKAKTKSKSAAKKSGTKSGTKKTGTSSSTAKKNDTKKTTKTGSAKKIDKSKAVKKSKKTDDRIKQIISEQLNNVDKFEEVKEVPDKKKKEKKKIDEKQIAEQIETAKKMPKDEKKKIYKKIFSNIVLGIVVTLYFIGIGIGFLNIEGPTFITDLKVFSLAILAIAIILFELAYGKDDDKTALYGIEMLFVAIISLVLIYICILHQDKFIAAANIVACVGVLYYLVKSISIYIREKMKWKKTISDVKEIVSEE